MEGLTGRVEGEGVTEGLKVERWLELTISTDRGYYVSISIMISTKSMRSIP